MPLVEILLGILTKSFNFGVECLKTLLVEKLSERTQLYQLVITELARIEKSLDNLIAEPFKTASLYLEFGLNTKNFNDFLICEQNAIKAYNLAQTLKTKIDALCIIAIANLYMYEPDICQTKMQIMFNDFIKDKCVSDLFSFIADNRYNKLSVVSHFSATICASIIGATIVLAPIILYIKWSPLNGMCSKNFMVRWPNRDSYGANNNMQLRWITKNSCHINNNLVLINMDKEMEDLHLMNNILTLFAKILNMDGPIDFGNDIFWNFNDDESLIDNKLKIRQNYFW
jgi:hypothetical protein